MFVWNVVKMECHCDDKSNLFVQQLFYFSQPISASERLPEKFLKIMFRNQWNAINPLSVCLILTHEIVR